MAANGHMTFFIIIGPNELSIYKQHSVKGSQQ